VRSRPKSAPPGKRSTAWRRAPCWRPLNQQCSARARPSSSVWAKVRARAWAEDLFRSIVLPCRLSPSCCYSLHSLRSAPPSRCFWALCRTRRSDKAGANQRSRPTLAPDRHQAIARLVELRKELRRLESSSAPDPRVPARSLPAADEAQNAPVPCGGFTIMRPETEPSRSADKARASRLRCGLLLAQGMAHRDEGKGAQRAVQRRPRPCRRCRSATLAPVFAHPKGPRCANRFLH